VLARFDILCITTVDNGVKYFCNQMTNNELIMFQNIIINNYVQRPAQQSILKLLLIKIHESFMILKPVFPLKKKKNNNLFNKNILCEECNVFKK